MRKESYCLSFKLSSHDLESVHALLYSAGMLGCEETKNTADDTLILKCYFKNRMDAQRVQKNLTDNHLGREISLSFVAFQDWNKKWRDEMKPILVTDNIWVSPQWLSPVVSKGEKWIKIEPKMAFGTGHHETTRLAAQSLISLKENKHKRTLLDIGTGTGILCFIGEKMGYQVCFGVEIDKDCLPALQENLSVNESEYTNKIMFIIGTIDSINNHSYFDTIVINMLLNRAKPLIYQCKQFLSKDGHLIWSGLLLEERDDIITFLSKQDWQLVEESRENEWWCGVFHNLIN